MTEIIKKQMLNTKVPVPIRPARRVYALVTVCDA